MVAVLRPRFRVGAVLVTAGVVAAAVATPASARQPSKAAATTAVTTVAAAPATENLLDATTASLENGVGAWTGTNVTLARTTAVAHSGRYSLSATSRTAGLISLTSGMAAVSPGQTYTGTFWTRTKRATRTAQPVLMFTTATGDSAGVVWGQGLAVTSTAWTPMPKTIAIAPANAAFVQLAVIEYGTATGDVTYVDDASLVTSGLAVGSKAVAGPLHTEGNRIIDANGAPVTFRGINRNGYETGITPVNFTDDEIAHAKQWGANLIRVPLGSHYWLSSSPTFDPTYTTKIDAVVQSITSRGMVAMLDLHWHTITPGGTASQHFMADAPNSVTFWQEVATRYAANPLVAFDLYNEPHDITSAVWHDGGTVTENGITYTAAGMQQIYDAVRSTGADNLVFASGIDWGNTFPGALDGTNIVYAVHAYICPDALPPQCAAANPYDPSPILDRWLTASNTNPVMVTEFGWPSRDDGTYLANVIAYAEAHGWGWSAWDWDGGIWGQFSLLADVGPGATYNPSAAGMPVLEGLRRNA